MCQLNRTLLVAFLLALAGCASTGSTNAPSGYTDYCNRHADRAECRKTTRLPQNWRQIAEDVQAEVNKLPYRADLERHGHAEFWDRIDSEGGDCEDFALEKLRLLVEAGFPIERVRLGTVIIPRFTSRGNRNHVVVVVDGYTDKFILDNRFPRVVPIAALIGQMYTLLNIQSIGGSRQWVEWKFT